VFQLAREFSQEPKMRKFMLIMVMFGLFLPLTGARAADELSDAAVIINAKANSVKKWRYPPRFVVVHDQPVDRDAFDEVTGFISQATGLDVPVPQYVDLSGDMLDDRFYTASRYTPRNEGPGRMTSDLLIAGREDLLLSANIYVFVVSPPLASHFMVLTAYGRSSNSLPRAYAQGTGPCYFNVLSNAESIHFGTILIAPGLDGAFTKACIYEEMVQAMGLVNDAQDSPFFTFDNLAPSKPREYDLRLLSALYDPSVQTGDAVNKVLNIYAERR
jgi:hypothetical protein